MADGTGCVTAPGISSETEARRVRFLDAFAASGLAAAGVPAPSGGHFWALMLLFENMGKPVTQKQIVDFYVDNGLGHYDRQLRHKAAAGWPLASSNSRTQNMEFRAEFPRDSISLLHMDGRNPILTANRKVQMTGVQWDEKVQLFERVRGGCGMCGHKCRSYDRGHLDRHLPLSADNSAPLCSSCNNFLQAVDQNAYIEEETLIVRVALPGSRRHERQRQRAKVNANGLSKDAARK